MLAGPRHVWTLLACRWLAHCQIYLLSLSRVWQPDLISTAWALAWLTAPVEIFLSLMNAEIFNLKGLNWLFYIGESRVLQESLWLFVDLVHQVTYLVLNAPHFVYALTARYLATLEQRVWGLFKQVWYWYCFAAFLYARVWSCLILLCGCLSFNWCSFRR